MLKRNLIIAVIFISVLFAIQTAAQDVSPGSTTVSFTNSSPIAIRDNNTAMPYPSTITVSGINPPIVTRIEVTLNGFQHFNPDDVDVILVGPNGQRAVLMSDAGGYESVEKLNLTFSQTATTPLPDDDLLTSGTFRPTNYFNLQNTIQGVNTMDTFPAPGPGTLTDAPADLGVFNLTDPNGNWNLFIVDDRQFGIGSISGGWTLTLTVPQIFFVTNTNDAGAGSLRDAITQAQNGDLINFSSLFNTPQTINLLTALPDINRSITIQGTGVNLLTVRRDSNAATEFRIFSVGVATNSGVAISGMTVTGGYLSNNDDVGGGIRNDTGAILSLTNVHITDNTAAIGGGVYLAPSSNGVFTNCTFSANSSTRPIYGGGGIRNLGNLTVTNSAISGNRAIDGGGILNSGSLTVTDSTISGNTATYSEGSSGGIVNSGDNLTIINSTISGNRALFGFNNGGGIRTAASGIVTITNSTITNNSAAGANSAGGVFRQDGVVRLRNSIIAGNVNNAFQPDVAASDNTNISTHGYNLIGNRGAIMFNQTGDQSGTGASPLAPLLAPLALNGGTTPTHALYGNSLALDKGNSSGFTSDQRGLRRPFDLVGPPNVSDGADIGAFEAQADPSVGNPNITINDVSQAEGNTGTSNFNFTVSLSAASGSPVTVNFQTADGTATAPTDYTAIGATTLTFNAGETTKQVSVSVNGDTAIESNETFFVNLSNPTGGATITDNQGLGTIVNDDGSCTYTLSPASPQSVPATSSNLNVTVTTPAGCAWTATTSTAWITINSGSSGNGNGTVNMTFAANTGAARSGSLTIAGQTYTINQAAGSIINVRAPFDYDGDNKTDISIFRPAPGEWWYLRSSNGTNFAAQFGASSDKITPADFTGDGKTDFAFFRPSTGNWFVLRSEDFSFFAFPFGANGDTPAPGDYDGDGRFDAAVFRPSNFTWFVQRTTQGTLIQQFGIAGDIPTPSAFVP